MDFIAGVLGLIGMCVASLFMFVIYTVFALILVFAIGFASLVVVDGILTICKLVVKGCKKLKRFLKYKGL